MEFNRNTIFDKLTDTEFDVAIIGGGINGAGIAVELSLRGFSVALVEKNDFASGTSSASSKLVHGGIRYLEHGHFKLVFEALKERYLLLKNAPHLVKKIPFLIPIYKDGIPFWKLKIGLWLYDFLCFFKKLKPHQILSAKDALKLEPLLNPDGLKGAALYYDAKMDDARVCLEIILQAKELGAVCLNYCEVIGLHQENKQIKHLKIQEKQSGKNGFIKAKFFVNATGPYSDTILEKLNPQHIPLLRLSKGIHIMTKRITQFHATVIISKKDNRVFFVIPWEAYTLIGTTDTDYQGPIDNIPIEEADIDYLLEETQKVFINIKIDKKDIISTFSGLRPLFKQKGRLSGASREHQLSVKENILSVIGGKYTTYRALSESIAKKICAIFKKKFMPGLTEELPFHGGEITDPYDYLEKNYEIDYQLYPFSKSIYLMLLNRYGNKYYLILSILNESPELLDPLPGTAYLKGEVIYAIRYEMAIYPEDFLRRRSSIALSGKSSDCLANINKLFKEYLNV